MTLTTSNHHANNSNQLQVFLKNQFPKLEFKKNEPLKNHLHLGLGGPAEVFWQATCPEDFIQVVKFAKKNQIPTTVLGWGSNVLVADRGVKGLVIQNKINQFKPINKLPTKLSNVDPVIIDNARWYHPKLDRKSSISEDNPKLIQVFSGTSLPWLINQLIDQGILGLHHFIKIPGTVGGAVVNNIHGGNYLFSQFVLGVQIIDSQGKVQILSADQLDFGYDFSRFHQSNEIITNVYLRLYQGNQDQINHAKKEIETMLQVKTNHEFKSLGCLWQNLDSKTVKELKLPTASTGYVIDKLLKLKGFKLGKVKISQKHAAFVVAEPEATADDYLKLMHYINQQAQEKLNLKLKPEIFFLGFTKSELEGII